jgi:hypothetical protein
MKFFALLAALAILGARPGHADPPKTPDEVMAFAIKQSAQNKTWSGTYSHLISDQGLPFPSDGGFLCKRPQELRVDSKSELLGSSMKMLLVVGPDHVLWLEASGKAGTSVMHGDLQKLPFSDIKSSVPQAIFVELMDLPHLWENSRSLYDFRVGTNEEWAGRSVLALYGTLKPAMLKDLLTPDLTQEVTTVTGLCRILVGEQDGFVYLMERSLTYKRKDHKPSPLSEGEGIAFKDVTFNGPAPDEKFVYRPPKDIPITELPIKDEPDGTDQPPPPATPGKK